jgi:hypothetical protein
MTVHSDERCGSGPNRRDAVRLARSVIGETRMHVLSKVLLGVVVVMAIIAVIMTSKLRLARGHWLQQVEQRQQNLEKVREDLRKQRLVVADARAEVNRRLNLWGNSWSPVPGQVVNPQLGAITLGIGTQQLRQPTEQEFAPLFLFAQSPQGDGSQYLGEFRPTGIQVDRTAAALTRQPYEGEVQSWPQQVPLRVRELIPSSWREIFSVLETRIAEAQQDVQDQTARLAKADELNTRSQEQLQRRLNQLEGNPDALEGSAPEVLDGLVEALRAAETDRNVNLGQLDDLRHEYDRKYRLLQELIQRNRQLEEMLPQPGEGASPSNDPQQALETSTQSTSR